MHRLVGSFLLLVLAGCASRAPVPAAATGRDGPPPGPPPAPHTLRDATPRVEPIRPGGPNKPYEVAGVRYVPLLEDLPYEEQGLASWYGRKYHGQPTSLGEPYDMYAMTAAHPRWPLPSYARVRNPANGREVIVRVNDRGPFAAGRVIDLSYAAALKLDLLRGVAPVLIQRLTTESIRQGTWPFSAAPPERVTARASSPPAD
ncbi:septal ring lytic transglycosylase RlpA family protein [Inhella gelatinilytica]|uniref:Endolytic peptidoglycan transglycosylase RlpA n=1 Tax=Inhella gelatinilytica TaxID=2795030 RepID=A0A931IUH2_9BURK|nr:septal ring lytic transglycosylase RlpA family protein [Inhella gelatinilytica]MBH9552177.1 septal ring lytic transglycosylase RlpA family protein [Inhella gelatinilytica]